MSASASPAPHSHVGPRDPCSSVLGRTSPVCEPPPTSGRRSQGRREDPSLLPPAAAQPSGPCECALPASRQDSEGRRSLGRTPHPGLVRAPSAGVHTARAPSALRPDPRSAPFNLPQGASSPGPARPLAHPLRPRLASGASAQLLGLTRRGLRPFRPFRPLQRLLPGQEAECLSVCFSLPSPRLISQKPG